MKPLHHLDNVFYPLGGMGYLVHDLADLFRHKVKALIDFSYFQECYGEAGFERLWLEAKDWAENPSKFFRNYSVDYFRLILGDGKEQMNVTRTRENPYTS